MEHDNYILSQLAVMLIFAPIIVDTFITVVRRTWAGHHPYERHLDFYFQRMILAGVPQRQVLALHVFATILYGILYYLIEVPLVLPL